MTLLIMSICTVLLEKLYTIKRAQEARQNQFLFQNVQNNEIFEIFKIFKNIFKVKFDTKTDSNMQHSMLVSILSVLDSKATLFGKFGPKNRNCQF